MSTYHISIVPKPVDFSPDPGYVLEEIAEARDTLKDRVCGILVGNRSLAEIDEKIDALIAAVRRHERALASQADRE